MRKHIIVESGQQTSTASEKWLDLESNAMVEVTSEAEGFPVENAFRARADSAWRAAQPGEQIIRLTFDQPQHLHRIYLEFVESESARTQEFVLRCSSERGSSFRDIVRQQWNFSPSAAREEENYQVDIPAAIVLELRIVPDISRGDARASLKTLRVA